MLIEFLRKRLATSTKRKLLRFVQEVKAFGIKRDLIKLGLLYGTDKVEGHSYGQHYKHHFKEFRYKKIKLLEIGIGGGKAVDQGGGSLRLWKRYFPFGRIYGLDIYDKSALQEKRIEIFQGDQSDDNILQTIVAKSGELDIIIDDGSHLNSHVIKTFNNLFPHLKNGGIYVVEDVQTSYWSDYGGDSMNHNNLATIMGYFKSLVDGLNNQEYIIANYKQSYYDKNIIAMHFYHNMIFIRKGNNNELSNAIIDNKNNKYALE